MIKYFLDHALITTITSHFIALDNISKHANRNLIHKLRDNLFLPARMKVMNIWKKAYGYLIQVWPIYQRKWIFLNILKKCIILLYFFGVGGGESVYCSQELIISLLYNPKDGFCLCYDLVNITIVYVHVNVIHCLLQTSIKMQKQSSAYIKQMNLSTYF